MNNNKTSDPEKSELKPGTIDIPSDIPEGLFPELKPSNIPEGFPGSPPKGPGFPETKPFDPENFEPREFLTNPKEYGLELSDFDFDEHCDNIKRDVLEKYNKSNVKKPEDKDSESPPLYPFSPNIPKQSSKVPTKTNESCCGPPPEPDLGRITPEVLPERGSIGKLEFPLPEQQNDFNLAVNAIELVCCLNEIDQLCRNVQKYGREGIDCPDDLAEMIRNEINEVRHLME